jgi:hypothetical protein
VITLSEDVNLLKQIRDELREMKFWLKLSSFPTLKRVVLENIRDDVDKLIYELSDGVRSTREIARELKRMGKQISHATVANMWRKWSITGLVEPSEKYEGRYCKAISLESIGIQIPRSMKEDEKIA